jgi:hypothetical protein
MKATQILYLVIVLGIVYWVFSSTNLFDSLSEGFEDTLTRKITEPVIPKGLAPTKMDMEAMPNSSVLGSLPFGPYAQMASVGSFQYQDPAMLPAELSQMKKVYEDLRSFLVFEGVNISNSSDPTVQLPLTQLRADSERLQQEITVLGNNPGVQSQLTQQSLADIENALVFLQRKIRLFETSGVITGNSEGFSNYNTSTREGWADSTGSTGSTASPGKKASAEDLTVLQTKIYASILSLSSTGTTDPVVQARIGILQKMYSSVSDMLTKLANGQWKEDNIPVFKDDIITVLPNLSSPTMPIRDILSSGLNSSTTSSSDKSSLSLIEQQLANIVGAANATDVFNNLKEKGTFKVSFDLGYNTGVPGTKPSYKQSLDLQRDGSFRPSGMNNSRDKRGSSSSRESRDLSFTDSTTMQNELPFDSLTPGMDDNHAKNTPHADTSGFDWKKRTEAICEQVKLRGLDPLDFGCIPKNSLTSPAYSWRGHAKMVCGRLGTTMDPDLPNVCGCPPQKWKGWTLSV